MGLLPAHQVEVAQRTARVAGQRRRPDQTRGAVAEQIERLHAGDVIECGEVRDRGPALQLLPDWLKYTRTPSCVQVDQVGGARAVDIGEPDAAVVELIGHSQTRARCPS